MKHNDILIEIQSLGGQLSRRGFLKLSGAAGGGLLLAASFPSFGEESPTLVGSAELNAYVQVRGDGNIIIYSGSPEMGQGIKTSLPMIVAEEMGANWDDVEVIQAPEVNTELYGRQSTGGSYTLYLNWNLMREMGATARDMFIAAAAVALEVPRSELKAEGSQVTHVPTGQVRSFGELAALAHRQPVPSKETLVFKDREDYKILGQSISQVDSLEIVTGVGDFGIDTKVPNMLYGCYVKCPAVGGELVSANIDDIKSAPGIIDAWSIKGNGNVRELMDGVGIVGTDTWSVFKAREILDVKWDETKASKDSWQAFVAFAEAQDQTGEKVVVDVGDVDAAFTDPGHRVLSQLYEYPYVSHLCLEPMNCTADFRKDENGRDHLELWIPTQSGPRVQEMAKSRYGLDQDQVSIHMKRMGGSFGRRTSQEYVIEAVELSQRAGRPVKLTWNREDSVRYDFLREGGFTRLKGAVDVDGSVVAIEEHVIGVAPGGKPSRFTGPWASAFPFSTMKNIRASLTTRQMDTPVGPWRAPYSNTHAFASQSFFDELATLAGRDPIELMLELMGERRWITPDDVRALNTGRAIDVINTVAKKAQWGRPMPKGQGLGFAFYFCHAAHVAEIAEVSVDQNDRVTLHKVTAAVDVGPIINMSGAMSQVQGAIIDGYSTMAGQKITMENGRVQQTNLDQYPVLRIGQAPEIDVHFIQSDFDPTGLGEPALPPLAPAVANAIFAATGRRVRKMPISDVGFSV